jgi:hypothetical protein
MFLCQFAGKAEPFSPVPTETVATKKESKRQALGVKLIVGSVRQASANIARCIGKNGISEPTLRKHFPHELKTGVAKINGLCVQALVRAMQKGEPWAVCFWAKARMGWREKSTVEHQTLDEEGQPTRPGITIIVTGAPSVPASSGKVIDATAGKIEPKG